LFGFSGLGSDSTKNSDNNNLQFPKMDFDFDVRKDLLPKVKQEAFMEEEIIS
jgi:hypothetical protein